MSKKLLSLLTVVILSFSVLTGYTPQTEAPLPSPELQAEQENGAEEFDLSQIPEFDGTPLVEVNGNFPFFTLKELSIDSFEEYHELDELGRCGTAFACIGQDLMPVEERGNIGMVKPSGWQLIKYDNVDGKYLYNRCHLIGYQLSGENANVENLITGTRFLNISGMLSLENKVADYVKETGNHVMYRVTPVFEGDNLVASGVLMEGWSVEDAGEGVCFCVFAYNAQPGIAIDYATGESRADASVPAAKPVIWSSPAPEAPANSFDADEKDSAEAAASYILNTKSMKFHSPDCSRADSISQSNKSEYTGSRDELIAQGYQPCKNCNP